VQQRILVIGAINVDLVERVERFPQRGETVAALSSHRSPGGKAANQAAAAAHHLPDPGQVMLVGAVGDDQHGLEQVELLDKAGVDTRLIRRVMGTATGSAVVIVDEHGENRIIVNAGANRFVSAGNLYGAPAAAVVVAQTEVSTAAVSAAAHHARTYGARFIVNNGPVATLDSEVLVQCDPLVVNEGEARAMLGDQASGREHLAKRLVRGTECVSAVVTLGRDGCVWATRDNNGSIPGRFVADVVDTTGAGDFFVGTLAAELSRGSDLPAAADTATAAAAQSVRWTGTRVPEHIGASGSPMPD
jgi:ribokinase